eukprot:2736520-Amphidinium_carterae.1
MYWSRAGLAHVRSLPSTNSVVFKTIGRKLQELFAKDKGYHEVQEEEKLIVKYVSAYMTCQHETKFKKVQRILRACERNTDKWPTALREIFVSVSPEEAGYVTILREIPMYQD